MTKRDRGTPETRTKLEQSPVWCLLKSKFLLPEHADAWNELSDAYSAAYGSLGYVMQRFEGKGVDTSKHWSTGASEAQQRLINRMNWWTDILFQKGGKWEQAHKAVLLTFGGYSLREIGKCFAGNHHKAARRIRMGLDEYCRFHGMITAEKAA